MDQKGKASSTTKGKDWKTGPRNRVASLLPTTPRRIRLLGTPKAKDHSEERGGEEEAIPLRVDTKAKLWLSSFGRSDPRWQIMQFFLNLDTTTASNSNASSDVFTVWRPTSTIAIQRMMAGEATGKGLEIKGKSSKAGKLSGFVPYLQIHDEAHKGKVKTLPRGGRTRIFYATSTERDAVLEVLEPLQNQILNTVQDAKRTVKKTAVSGFKPIVRTMGRAKSHAGSLASSLGKATGADEVLKKSAAGADSFRKKTVANADVSVSSVRSSLKGALPDAVGRLSLRGRSKGASNKDDDNADDREWALKRLLWDTDDPSIRTIDNYAPRCYGIELPDRLLWKASVVDSDISRPEGSDYYTARPSEPAFQDMNFIAIQSTRKNKVKKEKKGLFSSSLKMERSEEAPRVVLWQTSLREDPLDPRGLIMAYEEDGRVLPVVSDFDCFTMGSRNMSYEAPLPEEQLKLLDWCVKQVESVLDKQTDSPRSWTSCWLEVLKISASKGFHPTMPRYGFGDPISYGIMESAVSTLKENGSVRHGAECFNYYFPQELDSEFLIVSDRLPGASWKYVGAQELQRFLLDRIEDGFTFPLNPKWVLCDDGWKEIYDRLVSSKQPNVQDSLKVWFPVAVRERMESVSERHPRGFVSSSAKRGDEESNGTEAMDLATLELGQFLAARRAKAKLRAVISFNSLLLRVRRRNAAQGEEAVQIVQQP